MKASQPDAGICAFCGQPLPGDLAPHLCAACGRPQPVRRDDYFTAFGLKPGFHVDGVELEKRFYAISRALHPDRFADKDHAGDQANSMERMSLLNSAYSVLRNREKLRAYLLTLEGIDLPVGEQARAQLPAELAEAWFEVKDAAEQDPATAAGKIREFETAFRAVLEKREAEIQALEEDYDRNRVRETLFRIAALLRGKNYLRSLERDLLKMKKAVCR